MESKTYLFYLWQNRYWDSDCEEPKSRICFGITGNLDNRQNGYEGHVGHAVKWMAVWTGPERLIRELESKVKVDFKDFLWCGHRDYRYEWLDESISMDQIIGWVEFELDGISTVEKII